MNPARVLQASPLLAPLLFAWGALALPSDEVVFRPKAGSEVKKELKIEVELEPGHLEFTMNGEAMPEDSVSGLDEAATMKLAPSKGRGIDHIGFDVKDLDAFSKRLEGMGLKFDAPPRAIQNAPTRVAFFTDPWGTYIEVTEKLAPSR